MQLPPMLRAVQQQQQLQQMLDGAAVEEVKQQQPEVSLSEIGYDLIDLAGDQFKKVAPLVNKTLEWAWFPLVLYYGLKKGTHKFYPGDAANVPEDMEGVPMERSASWTDAVPFVGSHGSSQGGMILPDH